jgi:hypothetical protein
VLRTSRRRSVASSRYHDVAASQYRGVAISRHGRSSAQRNRAPRDRFAALFNARFHDVRRQLAEHRGRPLREWRRAFFLEARMKPTRTAVLSDPLFRVKRDKFWFKQSYPHFEEGGGSIEQTTHLIGDFVATLGLTDSEKSSQFRGQKVAFTTLEHAMNGLLLDLKIPHETVTWYAHLVTLSDLNARDPQKPVTVVLVDNNGQARKREKERNKKSIKLFQGRSSSKDGQGGDDEMISESDVTLQIHHLEIEGTKLYAIAVHVPRVMDALASGTAK